MHLAQGWHWEAPNRETGLVQMSQSGRLGEVAAVLKMVAPSSGGSYLKSLYLCEQASGRAGVRPILSTPWMLLPYLTSCNPQHSVRHSKLFSVLLMELK